jgi:hypothetical protein
MSDYLNNIVSRSLSVAEVVQPRVPHLFEQTPAGVVSAEDVVPVLSAETSFDFGRAGESSYAPAPPATVTLPHIAAPSFEPFRTEPSREAAVPARAPARVSDAPEQPTPAAEVTNRIIRPAVPEDVGPIVCTVPPRVAVPNQPRVTRGQTQAENFPGSIEPDRTAPARNDRSVIIRVPERATPTHPSIANAVLPPPPLNQPAEQSLPPIKINIGRVEVRAVMPAAPPPVSYAVRAKPALSLESYLKQREEGKR